MEAKDREINNLREQVFSLMGRRTTIGEGTNLVRENIRLTEENQRLRNERNHY
jgi:hypothetical protein